MTDYQTNLKILESILQLPDNRGFFASIFCERTFTSEEIQKAVSSVSGLSLEALLSSNKEGYFLLEDPNKLQWETERGYTFDWTRPPHMQKKAGPDYFELINDGSKYKLKIFHVYQQIYKKGKRPENQRIIKTKSLSEVNELLGGGFCLVDTERISEEVLCGLDGETATETIQSTVYTLTKKD